MVRVLRDFSAADQLLVLATLPSGTTSAKGPLLDFARRLEARLAANPDVSAVVFQPDETTRHFFERELVPAGLYYLNDAGLAAARRRLTRPEMDRQFAQDQAMLAVPEPAAGGIAASLIMDPLRMRDFISDAIKSRQPTGSGGDSGFFAPDGRSLLVRVIGKQSLGNIAFARSITDAVTRAADAVNNDHLRLDLSGGYAIAAASERAIKHDLIISVSGGVVLLQVLFVFAYRRPVRTFVLAFVPIATGVCVGFGLRAALTPLISPAAAVVGGILAGLGIDYTVLYLPRYGATRQAGLLPVPAAVATSCGLGPTLTAACATSLIGFAAAGASSLPALRDFALVGSLGLAGALAMTFLLLPAALILGDRGRVGPPTPRAWASAALALIDRHARPAGFATASVGLIALTIVAIHPTRNLPPEQDLTVMHPRPNPPLDAESFIAKRMGFEPGSLMILLQATDDDALLRLAHSVDRRLKAAPAARAGIVGAYGPATLLPDPGVVRARAAAFSPADLDHILADFEQSVAATDFNPASFAAYEIFLRHLLLAPPAPGVSDLRPYPRLAETMLARNGHEALVQVLVDRPLDDRAARTAVVAAARDAVASLPGATVTGLSVLALDAESTVRRDLPRMGALAAGLVGVYLLVFFRNVPDAALALLPAVYSLVVLAAVMRVTGLRLNSVNLVALPLLIGIDVDYGIFLVALARRAADARAALAGSIHAVCVSAAANVLGFGSLIGTSVPAIRSLGWAVGIGVAACACCGLLLLVPIVLATSPPPDVASPAGGAER